MRVELEGGRDREVGRVDIEKERRYREDREVGRGDRESVGVEKE